MVTKTDEKKETSVKVSVKKLEMRTLKIKIAGCKGPLVVHNWTEKAISEMLDKQMQSKPEGSKAAKDPQKAYEGSLYRYVDERGQEHYGFPVTAFKEGMKTANGTLKKYCGGKLDTSERVCPPAWSPDTPVTKTPRVHRAPTMR